MLQNFKPIKQKKLLQNFHLLIGILAKKKLNPKLIFLKKFDSFGKDEFQELSIIAMKLDIEFMSTGFDIESVTYINDIVVRHSTISADLTILS